MTLECLKMYCLVYNGSSRCRLNLSRWDTYIYVILLSFISIDGHSAGENSGEPTIHQRSPWSSQVGVGTEGWYNPETTARCSPAPGEARCCCQWGIIISGRKLYSVRNAMIESRQHCFIHVSSLSVGKAWFD